MANHLMSYEEWRRALSASGGETDPRIKRIDEAHKAFTAAPTNEAAFNGLRNALKDWQMRGGGYEGTSTHPAGQLYSMVMELDSGGPAYWRPLIQAEAMRWKISRPLPVDNLYEARVATLFILGNASVSHINKAGTAVEAITSGVRTVLGSLGADKFLSIPAVGGPLNGPATGFATNKVLNVPKELASAMETAFRTSADKPGGSSAATASQVQSINQETESFVKRILKQVWEYIKRTGGAIIGSYENFHADWKNILPDVAKLVSGWLVPSLFPCFKGSIELITALPKIYDLGIKRLELWYEARAVEIRTGFTTSVVDGVKRGMDFMMAEIAYDAAGSVATILGGVVVIPGLLDTLLTHLTAFLKAFVKLIVRYLEAATLKDCLLEAKKEYAKGRYERDGKLCFDGPPTGLAADAQKFDAWLGGWTKRCPMVGALVLGSGLTGNGLHYLKLINGDGRLITPRQFVKGQDNLAFLSKQARTYMKSSGFKINFVHAQLTAMYNANTVGEPLVTVMRL